MARGKDFTMRDTPPPPPPPPQHKKTINELLEQAVYKLLDTFDEMSVREQVATVAAVARIQLAFVKLRGEPDERNTGITVKKYAKAFETNAANKRKSNGRSPNLLDELDDDSGDNNDELEY